MDNILIAGCGYVGTALGQHLAKQNYKVWGITRKKQTLPDGITPITADLNIPESLNRIPENINYVFFTASAPNYSDEGYSEIYINGLKNLLKHLKKTQNNIKRIIFTSSTAVYSQTGGIWVDEKSEAKPAHFTGKRILQAEEILTKSKFNVAIIRFGSIYGPTRTRLINEVLAGKAHYTETEIYTNRIHQTDCINCLQHLMHTPGDNEIYIGVDEEPTQQNEVIGWLGEELRCPIAEQIHISAPANRIRANRRCDSSKLRSTGFEFTYRNFKQGFMSVLDEDAFADEAIAV